MAKEVVLLQAQPELVVAQAQKEEKEEVPQPAQPETHVVEHWARQVVVVLVRRAFPEWSGLYAYAAVLGHLILVVPQSICGALFPKVVKASFTERVALYRSSAWTTLGAIVLLSLGVVVFGSFLLGLLFGPEAVTDESVRWLRYIALSLIPICYLQYTVQFALAIKQFRWLWMVLVFALVLVGLLEAGLVTSPDGLIGWMAGLALMLAVGIDCRIRRVLARESVA